MAQTGTAVKAGRKTVTTAGTAVQLVTSTQTFSCSGVWITPLSTNTGVIAVGDSGVLATSATRNGLAFSATSPAQFIAVDDPALLWIDATVNGEGCSYLLVFE